MRPSPTLLNLAIRHCETPHLVSRGSILISNISNGNTLARQFKPFSDTLLNQKSHFSTQKPHSQPEIIKGVPFSELGANRTVKIVVYIAVGIIGTAETYAWGRFLWGKYGPQQGEDGEGEVER
jgi:hypothetical protein